MSIPIHIITNHSTTEGKLQEGLPRRTEEVYSQFKGNKTKWREWQRHPETEHHFYSTFEPLNPSQRLSESNPPHLMHGWAGDYDSPRIAALTDEEVWKLVHDKCPGGLRPTFAHRTFSGMIRLTWLFEQPVPADNEEVLKAFMKQFAKETKAEALLPGLDKASFHPFTYWEYSGERHTLGDPLSPQTVERIFFNAVSGLRVSTSDINIPLEVVAEEVEKRFPNRWEGEFSEGARGPLFWVNDGIERVGAQVTPEGMICYSTRAGSNFMSWREIFGSDFTREYEEKRLEEVVDDVWFTGQHYLTRLPFEGWSRLNKEDFVLRLKAHGFEVGKPKKGKLISEAEEALIYVQDYRFIHGMAPFVFNKSEIVTHNGYKYLNIANAEPIQPADNGDPENFPWIYRFLTQVWDPVPINGVMPDKYYTAWLQRAYKSALEGKPESGHAVVIAGPPGLGKSLLSVFLLRKMFGGSSDAGDYLLNGGSGFNKELGGVGIWYVDDNTSAASFSDHRKFSEMLKKHVATPEVKYHPKYLDSVVLPWRGRLVVTCNTDADSLSIVPNLDGTILDKLMLFKFRDDGWDPQFLPSYELEAMIEKELPYFCKWLMDWEPPEAIVKGVSARYGVVPYHHPDIVSVAREASADHRIVEILNLWRKQFGKMSETTVWEGNATELVAAFSAVEGLQAVVKDYSPIRLGRALHKVEDYCPFLTLKSKNGYSYYEIDLGTED